MSYFSAHWFRVAKLCPRLVPQLRLERHCVRGIPWQVLSEAHTGRSCRLNQAAWSIVGRFDGRTNLQTLWDQVHGADIEVLSQQELVDLLVLLHERGLVTFDHTFEPGSWLVGAKQVAPSAKRFNLLAWRLPLGDPSASLERATCLVKALFSGPALAIWCAGLLLLILGVSQSWPALHSYANTWMGTPRYLFLMTLLYPPIKLAHEMAHALAIKRWGGQVHECGITFMLFMPLPYVDASAASAFRSPWQRAAVSAAGIMAELALAMGGYALWRGCDPGWLKDAGFVALFIGTLSTLLFNANPLQRFDGYFILTDLLQLPNLATRSHKFWRQWIEQRWLHLRVDDALVLAPAERRWLLAYAPLASLYKIVLWLSLTTWVGQWWQSGGIAVGALLLWHWFLAPWWRTWQTLSQAAGAQAQQSRWVRASACAAALVAGILLLPLPFHYVLQGVVLAPEEAQIRTTSEGFVERQWHRSGDWVHAGDLVLQLNNAQLQARLARQEAKITALEDEEFQAQQSDSVRAQVVQASLDGAQTELAQLQDKWQALQVRARSAGRLVLQEGTQLQGHYVHQGDLLGHIITGQGPLVRTVADQGQASLIAARTLGVQVRLVDAWHQAYTAQLVHDTVSAAWRLPSAALSDMNGGTVSTDPKDKGQTQTRQPVVWLDVRLHGPASELLGTRAWVRYDLGYAPLAWQWARWGRQRILNVFNART